MTEQLTVSHVQGLPGLMQFAAHIDQLNAHSARPSAYASSAYLKNLVTNNEYHAPNTGECLMLVHEAGVLVGCVPMRQLKERITPAVFGPFQLHSTKWEFLAAADSEQIKLLCAPQDEERVAAAVVQHLCASTPRWGMLEWVGQQPGGTLHRALHAMTGKHFRARDIAVEPIAEVRLSWPDMAAYYRSLGKHMRSNISRQARRLYATGATELVLAQGGEQCGAWFDAYCDLDARSWKNDTPSSIERSPKRVAFFQKVAAGESGFDPSFIGVLLDGVLIAGLLIGANATSSPTKHGAWCLEMAYDRTRADLGPGQLLLLLAAGEAIRRGDSFLNYLQNFAYYKHRWGADLIPVVNVQLLRRRSLHAARAWIGELQREWKAKRAEGMSPDATTPAPAATADKDASTPPPAPIDMAHARALAAQAITHSGPLLRRLDSAAARAYLPFELD